MGNLILGYIRILHMILCVVGYLMGVFCATGGIAFFFAYPVYLFGYPTLATVVYITILLGFFVNYLNTLRQKRRRLNIADSMVSQVVASALVSHTPPDTPSPTEKEKYPEYFKPSDN